MTTSSIRLNASQVQAAPRAVARLGELFAGAMAMLTQPARPAASNPAREAGEVRAMARRYEQSDPSFAAELYAAADRHEELYGA